MEVAHALKLVQLLRADRTAQSLLQCVLAGCFIFPATVSAESNWLTVVGQQDDPRNDVVQVEPPLKRTSTNLQTLNIRVSRASQRISWDNVPYRSYTSTVVIDCADKSGRYVEIAFHMMPMWEGKSHKTSVFSQTEVRPMLFRDVTPNPTERIIKAACFNVSP